MSRNSKTKEKERDAKEWDSASDQGQNWDSKDRMTIQPKISFFCYLPLPHGVHP